MVEVAYTSFDCVKSDEFRLHALLLDRSLYKICFEVLEMKVKGANAILKKSYLADNFTLTL